MQGVGNLKSLTKAPLAVFLFVVVMGSCLLLYMSENPVENNIGKSWLWKSHYKLERDELAKVLKKASMGDRTVILTTLNGAWAGPGSVVDLFLESFHIGQGTQRLLKHLVIVAMDQKAFDRCKIIHYPDNCFSLQTPDVNFTSEKRFMSPDYLKLLWRRIDLLRIVLELGYNFVFTDADVMWFRDPFPHFHVEDEIMIACDQYLGHQLDGRNRANAGFSYVKSVEASIEFYKYWYFARMFHPNAHDQYVFEIIKNDPIVRRFGIRISYLDTNYFGGFCEPSMDMNKVCTMHANCCLGIERKIHDLRLVLDDWKNFTKLSQPDERLKGAFSSSSSSSPWRAPDKCKWW